MAEPIVQLTPDILDKLSKDFANDLAPQDQAEFQKRANAWRHQADSVHSIRDQRITLLITQAGLQTQAELAQTHLDGAKNFISLDPKDLYIAGTFRIILGHIQVALYQKQDLLPPLLKPLRRFARPTHPYLDPFAIEAETTKQLAETTGIQIQDPEYERRLNEQIKDLAQSRNRLVFFCDQKAGSDGSLIQKYVAILPDRAHQVSQAFAEQNYLSPIQLGRFRYFVDDIGNIMRGGHADMRGIETHYHGFRRKVFRTVPSDKNPEAEQIESMDQHLKEVWKTWIAYNIETSLAKQLSLTAPIVPTILLRP